MSKNIFQTKEQELSEKKLFNLFHNKNIIFSAFHKQYSVVEYNNYKALAKAFGAKSYYTVQEANEKQLEQADFVLATGFVLLKNEQTNSYEDAGYGDFPFYMDFIDMINKYNIPTVFCLNDFLYKITLPLSSTGSAKMFGSQEEKVNIAGEKLLSQKTKYVLSMFNKQDTISHLDEPMSGSELFCFDWQKIAANAIDLPKYKKNNRDYSFAYIGGSRYGNRSKFLSELALNISTSGLKSYFGGHISNSIQQELLNDKVENDNNIVLNNEFIKDASVVKELYKNSTFSVLPAEKGYGETMTTRFFEGLANNILLVHESWLQNKIVSYYVDEFKKNTDLNVVYSNSDEAANIIKQYELNNSEKQNFEFMENVSRRIVDDIRKYNERFIHD